MGLRPLVAVLLAGMVALNATIAWLGHLDAQVAAAVAAAEHRRLAAFQLAEHLRVRSNDMTRLGRLYVLTGEARYLAYYEELLAIRNGTAPRPDPYDSGFWMRVVAEGKRGVTYGPPRSLRDLLRDHDATAAEFEALDAARAKADELATIELATMRERARRQDAARAPLAPEATADLQLRFADADYHRRKADVLGAIEVFTGLVDDRLQRETGALRERSAAYRRGQTALFFGVLGFCGLVLLVAERIGVLPMRRLVRTTAAFQQGRYDARAEVDTPVAEVRQLAAAFNQMAEAVQGDVVRQQQLQRDIAQSRDELRERNELFGRLCDAVDVVFWIGEVDFSRWRYVNPAYERLWGWPVDDLYRDPALFLRSVHPDDVDTVVKAMTAAGAGGEANIEYRVRTRAGVERWVWSRAFGARDASGKVVFTTGTTTDITPRKEMELRLAERTRELATALDRAAESEARFRIMAEAVDTIIWIAEPDLSRFRYINPAFERLLGFTAAELYADPGALIKTLCQEDTQLVLDSLGRAAAGGEADFEYRAYARNGRMLWLWTRAFAARDASGKVAFVAGTSTDMTARKLLEAQLRQSEQEASAAAQRLRGLTDNSPSLLWEARQAAPGEQVRFTYVSKGAERFFHPYTVADVLRDSNVIVEAVHPDDRARMISEINRTTREELPRFALEYRTRRPDGSYRWVHTVGEQVPEPGGGFVNYGFTADIHELKTLQDELDQARELAESASHAKSTFLATMSHEIRTPMIGVTGMLEILSHTRLNAEQRRAVNVVQQSAQSLLQIIGDILDFSKIEAGKLELAPATVSLPDLIESIAQNFMPPASSKGVRLTYEVDPALAPAHRVDAGRLRQILSNFLSNALKFTEHGSITLRAVALESAAQAQVVEFAVVDTGIGVSEENQRKLFEPFAQAESATTRRYGGTGLGLSICRRLAELMDGTIAMESREGAGTTLRLRVALERGDPAQLEAPQTLAQPKVAGRRPPARKRALAEGSLLLLVEDHATNRLVLAEQFALAGFTLDIAADGEQGLALWRKHRYGMVFTDLHMPRMDGVALARAIRAAEQAGNRPRTAIVALTAAALRDENQRCLEAGMDDVIVKPTTVPQLALKLRQWLPGLAWQEGTAAAPPRAQRASRDGFDGGVLTALTSGNGAMLKTIIADFQQTTAHDLDALDEAAEREDAVAVMRHAHRIRGASGIVGAIEMAGLSVRLESAGRLADWGTIRALRPQLADAFRRLRARLEAMA